MQDNLRSTPSRRSFIAAVGTGFSVFVAGCFGSDNDTNDNDNSPSDPAPTNSDDGGSNETNDRDTTAPIPMPDVELEFRHFDSTRLINVYHESGDDITTENTARLEVSGDVDTTRLVVDSDSDAPYRAGQQLFDDIRIFEGDSLTVTWFSNDGDRKDVIGEFTA